jgi:catechol 2,3-dioxygenase-like lactoylglutathione lyase family enzyme
VLDDHSSQKLRALNISVARYLSGVPITGLDHVQLAAPPGSEGQARRFYGELLGLVEVEKPAPLRARGGVWFELGAQQLHVGIDADFMPARKAHPALAVPAEELDRLAERIEAAGAEVKWDRELHGVRRFYSQDPWGNRVELISAD